MRLDSGAIYIALLHHPVYNKQGEEVTTSITGFDLHDIARTAKTYDVRRYFVVNPLPAQRTFAERILRLWKEPESREFNWTRFEALEMIELMNTLEDVIEKIVRVEKNMPRLIATSAKPIGNLTFLALREEMRLSSQPYLFLFGTGWGLTQETIAQADGAIEPIQGRSSYNHLPVRSAVAILLDRLCRVPA